MNWVEAVLGIVADFDQNGREKIFINEGQLWKTLKNMLVKHYI